MVDTIRTDAYLLGSEFQDGQAAGSITPQDMRDIVVSKVNVQDVYDDPTNTSGLGAPATIRGTVYAHKAAGFTFGLGTTGPQKTANATALQNAINYASANGKIFEAIPGTYEFSAAGGLVIPYSGNQFIWRGALTTQLVNYSATSSGGPVLCIGDPAGNNWTYRVDLDGVALAFGAAQTGLTSSCYLQIAALNQSRIKNMAAGQPGDPYAYNAVNILGPNSAFSNVFETWMVGGAQNTLLNAPVIGTGNIWDNVYMQNYGDALGGRYLSIGVTQAFNEQEFRQINFEHGKCNVMADIENAYGLTMRHVHVEDVTLTGSNPQFFLVNGHNIMLDQVSMVNNIVNTTNMSGNGFFINAYAPAENVINVNNLVWYQVSAGQINAPVYMFWNGGLPTYSNSSCHIRGGELKDFGGGNFATLNLDPHMPVSASAFLTPAQFEQYSYGLHGSVMTKAVINVSATYTHYGQFEDALLVVQNSITSFTITLAATMGATGNALPRTGNVCAIFRVNGTMSGTLTVKDAGGTTLTTNTTSTTLYYRFNGTAWATFTPVS